jgi:hypothetical protein
MFQEHLSNRDPLDHFVYIMSAIDDDWQLVPLVKVGISQHPKKRLKQVRADVGHTVVLAATFPFWKRSHAFIVEQAFHKACAGCRVKGEWFDMTVADAVGVMDKNLREFVDCYLNPQETIDYYFACDRVAVPGFNQLAEIETFGYRS